MYHCREVSAITANQRQWCVLLPFDQLDTPQFVTNANAEVVWQNNTDAFGYSEQIELSPEHITQPLRFQGQYFDAESGLHYNRYRYYSPKQQRFINQDPIGLAGGINHYQYAPNPINWVDPMGLSCKEGVAIVRQFVNGYQEGHFKEFVHDDLAYASHQVNLNSQGTETTIVRAGRYNGTHKAVHTATVPLQDAKAAIDFQKSQINEELGRYDVMENGCMLMY